MSTFIEEEYRTKRVKQQDKRSNLASKSAFNHLSKSGKRSNSGYAKLPSREVTFKITGGGTTLKGIKNGIDYITRDGELEGYFYDPDVGEYNGKGDYFNEIVTDTLSDNDYNKKYRGQNVDHVKNMVFSAPPHLKISKEDMLSSFQHMMKEKYPNNSYVAVYHEDKEDHPHLHVNLKLRDEETGKRIRLTKETTQNFRKDFTKNLQELGHDVSCTFKKDLYREQQRELQLENETQPEKMRNVYKVKEFGTTNYKNDPKNKRTGFITYETLKGGKEVTIWGKDLIQKSEDEKLKVGSLVRIKKLEPTIIKTPSFDKSGQKIGMKESKMNNWQIENIALNHDRNYTIQKEKINDRTPEQQQRSINEHAKKIELLRTPRKVGHDLGY